MRWLVLLSLFWSFLSFAGDDPPPPQPGTAAPLDPITKHQYRWLKPKRGRLPPNPRQSVDFTAYTLEWGEVEIGLASVRLGLLPRVQVGTAPILDVLGLYNGQVKVDLVRVGPIDLAVQGVGHYLPLGDFEALYAGAGGLASIRLSPAWSIHGGVRYNRLAVHGVPDFSKLSPIFSDLTGAELADFQIPPETFKTEPRVTGEAWLFEVATDVRLNRRDSMVIRGQFVGRAKADGDLGFEPPGMLGIDQTFAYDEKIPLRSSYMVSLSYQISWRHLQVRGGFGASAVPYAWLLQATDVSYRMWGRTRRTEARTKRGWRRGRHDVGEAGDVTVDESPPTP